MKSQLNYSNLAFLWNLIPLQFNFILNSFKCCKYNINISLNGELQENFTNTKYSLPFPFYHIFTYLIFYVTNYLSYIFKYFCIFAFFPTSFYFKYSFLFIYRNIIAFIHLLFRPVLFLFCFVSPEFSYRPGLGAVAESSPSGSSPGAAGSGSGGAPNRPLPPTPDDDESQGDKTLVLRRVSKSVNLAAHFKKLLFFYCVVVAVF